MGQELSFPYLVAPKTQGGQLVEAVKELSNAELSHHQKSVLATWAGSPLTRALHGVWLSHATLAAVWDALLEAALSCITGECSHIKSIESFVTVPYFLLFEK